MTKRPRNSNQLAKAIIGIATGEIEDREIKATRRPGRRRLAETKEAAN